MEEAPDRPAYGSPCNGCGVCCKQEPCPLAVRVLRVSYESGRCPALEHADGAYRCGLVANPAKYAKARAMVKGKKALSDGAAVLIGAGFGCDYRTSRGEETDEIAARISRIIEDNRKEADRAALAWGVLDGRREK